MGDVEIGAGVAVGDSDAKVDMDVMTVIVGSTGDGDTADSRS